MHSWKLLEQFRRELEKVAPCCVPAQRKGGPERLLSEEDYLCAFLFAQFNPVIASMRAFCACSELERVQQDVCSRPVSLGSFSEAQGVFGYQRLAQVFERLVEEKIQRGQPGPAATGKVPPLLRLVDSSVFHALPRMAWAQWRHRSGDECALRVHLIFNVLDGEPSNMRLTGARRCERKGFAEMISPGEFYVGDRNFSRDYKLLMALESAGCGLVIRLCEHANFTVLEKLPIREEDRAAGVVSDQIVRLGARERWHAGPFRVIRIEKSDLDEPVILVTNWLDAESFPASLVGEIYRLRWAIELFFKWLKCTLGRPKQWHWFAESPQGTHIQIYTALIAALLLTRRLGRLPNKRCMELLHFHSMAWVSEAELDTGLQRQLRKKKA